MITTDAHGQEWLTGPGAPEPLDRKPGRPPAVGTARDAHLFVRLTKAERAAMEKAAKKADESLTAWARRRLVALAEE